MAYAYYSRNNSYSRSLNAEIAENENRFPLTRAAAFMNLSIKAFKAGCEKCKYSPSEWHHVGKYANRVDYYDTTELNDSLFFWKGATTKLNKDYCNEQIKRIVEKSLKFKMTTDIAKNVVSISKGYFGDFYVKLGVENEHNFNKAFKIICKKYLAKPVELEMKKSDFATPIKSFILFENGEIKSANLGNTYSSSQIDFNNYFVAGYRNGGVFFRRIY